MGWEAEHSSNNNNVSPPPPRNNNGESSSSVTPRPPTTAMTSAPTTTTMVIPPLQGDKGRQPQVSHAVTAPGCACSRCCSSRLHSCTVTGCSRCQSPGVLCSWSRLAAVGCSRSHASAAPSLWASCLVLALTRSWSSRARSFLRPVLASGLSLWPRPAARVPCGHGRDRNRTPNSKRRSLFTVCRLFAFRWF